ncbi:MAG: prolyl oligopeptidase family serine peptidase [Melioribacteraceae bacterium]|nr:prolyl oligopeptidase family serine peptidase [Melioribacteraceae bacterium]
MFPDNKGLSKFIKSLLSIILIITFTSCSDSGTDPEDEKLKERGDIYSSESGNIYTTQTINTLISAAASGTPLPTINFLYDVKFVSIEYQTVDYNNKKVKASGALYIPQTDKSFPLISIQHGTLLKRTAAASNSPLSITEGAFGLTMASMGYVSCVPDLLGFGTSDIIHPYVHGKGNSNAVVDFMRAARNYCEEHGIMLNGQVFLGGYSEGGYVTLATQKDIEQNYSNEFHLTAVAPMAGPYDLNYTMDWIVNKGKYDYPGYISYFLVAYNEVYGWNRLNDFFVSSLSGNIRAMFNGSRDFNSVNNELPKSVEGLLNSKIIDGIRNRTDAEFLSKIDENSLLEWNPVAPITLYHGNADNAVHYQNCVHAYEALSTRTSSFVKIVTIQGGTHESSVLPSVIGMIGWFESLKQTSYFAKAN